MTQLILRGLFMLMSASVAGLYAVRTFKESATSLLVAIGIALSVSVLVILADVLTPRKQISALSGVFLGLIVGMLATYALSFLVDYVSTMFEDMTPELIEGTKVFIGVICVFVAISMVLQTKDDFRFVIPYVELAKQIRGTRPMLLDTSAIIDGRITDIASTQVLQGLIVVPRFVLNEMQTISDSADRLKRARGRRGLDILSQLQANPAVEVDIEDADAEGATVDQKLVALAQDIHARIITTDFNLTKVARVRGIEVINVNSLAEALRPVVLPGELMSVQIVKPGESSNQGVGYLEDGTMVVVEHARSRIGEKVNLTVTSALQTSAGRMIFGRMADEQTKAPTSGPRSGATAARPAAPSTPGA
ncbi:MAG: TRAM domain-containing protein [Phycisphaerae bacterium]|nr:TRAM domain-containing protein [Phycisphaerae bacterium]